MFGDMSEKAGIDLTALSTTRLLCAAISVNKGKRNVFSIVNSIPDFRAAATSCIAIIESPSSRKAITNLLKKLSIKLAGGSHR